VRSWLALAAAVLCGCSELGDVDRDECGNGVVEPSRGEDCDVGDAEDASCGAPGTAFECRILCVEAGATCPAHSVCGADGVCRAPDGTFGVTADTRWTARSLLVGDTTRDGLPELVGVSDQEILSMLGTPDGTYAAQLSVPNLPVFDEPRMSDINGDGAKDLTIPVGFGLYSLAGNPLTVLEPLFQNSFPVPGTGRLVTASIDHFIFDSTGQVPGPIPNAETLAALRVPAGPQCPTQGGCDVLILGDTGAPLPTGRTIDQIAGDTIAWTWIPGQENRQFVAALAFADDPATPALDSAVYLYTGDISVDPPTLSVGASTATYGTPEGAAWFADLDGDGQNDLVVATRAFGNPSLSISWGDGATFLAPTRLLGGLGPSQNGADPVAWGDLNGDGQADIVGRTGITMTRCAARSCTFQNTLVAEHAWVEARVADVDGDGQNDVVARADGAIVVDVLRNSGLPAVFNESPLTVPGAVKAVRTGDFDGNGSADVAIVTTTPGVEASDGLYVAYGRGGDGLAPVTYMGYVGAHVAIQPTTSLIPGRFDTITDLLVVAERGGSRGAALVLGSTSQRMIGPLIPIADDADITSAIVEGVVSLPLDGNATDDVICLITEGRANLEQRGVARVFTASTDGALTEATPPAGVTIETANFFLRGARWVTVPARGSAPAFVIGVDFLGRVAGIPITCGSDDCTAGALLDLTGADRGGDPVDLKAIDLDADGDLDLVGAFRPFEGDPSSASTSQVRVWLNDNGFAAAALKVEAPAGNAFAAVTAIDLDLDGTRELFALLRGSEPGLYSASPLPGGGGYGPLVRAVAMTDEGVDLAGGITLVGDDLTGDGLPDLVGVFGPERSPQNLKVLVQRERRGVLGAAQEDSP
jgi:hypothetical protein